MSCAWDETHPSCSRPDGPTPADIVATAPSVLEVPYGGSVHNATFWVTTRSRPLLTVAAFNAGGHLNRFRQRELRFALLEQCRRAGPPHCKLVSLGGRYSLWTDQDGRGRLGNVLQQLGRARFSLQPAGDDPARKSIIDSLTQGCIPVLFHEAQRRLWRLHWGEWANESHVYIPHERVIDGTANVMRLLEQIPLERVEAMQRTIARRAHQLVYSLSPSPAGAFNILARAVLRRQKQRQTRLQREESSIGPTTTKVGNARAEQAAQLPIPRWT